MHSKDPTIRKRISKACDQCYSRRHKCDGQLPCQRCHDAGQSCSYERVAKKRGPQGPNKRAKLDNDEDVVVKEEQGPGTPETGSPATVPLSTSFSLPGSIGAGINALGLSPASATSFSLPSGSGAMINPLALLRTPQSMPDPRTLLPPRDVVLRLVSVFFEHIHPFIPLIHRDSFLVNLETQSPVLVLSVCGATSGRGIPGMDPELQSHAERCLETCSTLLIPSMVNPEPIAPEFILASLHFDHAAGNRTHPQITDRWLGFSVASLLQRQINMDTEPSGNPEDWIAQEQLRRAWWRIFCYDRAAAMQNGRICMISEDANLLRLPVSHEIWSLPVAAGTAAYSVAPARYLPVGLEAIKMAVSSGELKDWNSTDLTLFLFAVFGHVNRVAMGLRGTDVGSSRDRNALLRSLESQRLSLLQILDAFWENLSMDMKMLDDEPLKWSRGPLPVVGGWTWSCAGEDPVAPSLLLLYHTLRILLVSPPDLSRMLRSTGWIFSPDFIVAVQNAGAVSRLLDAIMATNPDLHYVNPGLGFCVVVSASVHIVLVRSAAPHRRLLSEGSGASNNEHLATLHQVHTQALRDVEISIRAMEGLGRRWKLAQRTGKALRQAMLVLDWDGLENALSVNGRSLVAPATLGVPHAQDGKGANGGATPTEDSEENEDRGAGFALKVLADLADAQMRNKALEAAEEEMERLQQAASERPKFLGSAAYGAMNAFGTSGPQFAYSGYAGGVNSLPAIQDPLSVQRLIGGHTPNSMASPSFPMATETEHTGLSTGFGVPPTIQSGSYFSDGFGIGLQDELAMLLNGNVSGNTDFIFFQ